MTSIPSGIQFETSVGIPIPRLTYIPSRSSLAARRMIPSLSSFGMALPLPHGLAFDPLLARRHDDALDEDARRVDLVGVDLADLDELLDLRDRDLPRGGRHRVEVSRRLPVDEVSEPVGLPRGDEGEVGDDPALEDELAPLERLRLLPLGDHGPDPGRRVEARDARPSGPHPLRQRPLRAELELELSREELALELGVLADVRRQHLPDHLLPQEDAEAEVVAPAGVGDADEILHRPLGERPDQVLRDPAEAEAPHDEHLARGDVGDRPGGGFPGRIPHDDLVDHGVLPVPMSFSWPRRGARSAPPGPWR